MIRRVLNGGDKCPLSALPDIEKSRVQSGGLDGCPRFRVHNEDRRRDPRIQTGSPTASFVWCRYQTLPSGNVTCGQVGQLVDQFSATAGYKGGPNPISSKHCFTQSTVGCLLLLAEANFARIFFTMRSPRWPSRRRRRAS
jgi:hypothetical protein